MKSKQKRNKNDNGSINDENTNIAMIANNITNLEIVTNNDVNATTNAKNADIEPADTDNINMADIENDKADRDNDKSKDIIMSDHNDDNSAMSDNDSPETIPGNDNAEDSDLGENSTEDVPSPLFYGRKTNDPAKVKTSKRHRLIKVTPFEYPMGNPHVDKDATGKSNVYVFDPTDMQIHEFFFEGEPNPKDLEGVEEDKILEIHRTFQQKLKERDAERERNITYLINKALLQSVAQTTEMAKCDHSAATARVKSADKMVILPPLFDGTKPEVVKQHYKRFNQYIKFQTKSGNIRDPIGEAIELFEHTLEKKALVWFQEHKDKFVDLTTLKTMFLQRYNP